MKEESLLWENDRGVNSQQKYMKKLKRQIFKG